jgi:NAD(P)-dependent dehydrogenase (short-subunit alcohol dehydrogenase family)
MARVLVTGSADGLGQIAARQLVDAGHAVVLHARNEERAAVARSRVPGAQAVVIGDLSSIEATRDVASQVNRLGALDAVIHNAGVGYRDTRRTATADGLPRVFAVNSLAPYILTALIEKPRRLVYVSSGMHHGTDPGLDDLTWKKRSWNGSRAYAESKLHDVILAFAVARKWPDDMDAGSRTQVWLATSDEPAAKVTGGYFYHLKPRKANHAAANPSIQDRFLDECARLSGVPFPQKRLPPSGRPTSS